MDTSHDAVRAVTKAGGVATRKELLASATVGELKRALASGGVRKAGRGRYALPTDIEARRAAEEAHGTAILLSAAAHWQWRRMCEPRKPQIAVKRGRRVSSELKHVFDVRWRAIPPLKWSTDG